MPITVYRNGMHQYERTSESELEEWGQLMRARRVASPAISMLVTLLPMEFTSMVAPYDFISKVDLHLMIMGPEMKTMMYGMKVSSPERDYLLKNGMGAIACKFGEVGPVLEAWTPQLFAYPELVSQLKTPEAAVLWRHLFIPAVNAAEMYPEDNLRQWEVVQHKLETMIQK